MYYCKNCGKPLSGSKPFCRYCGARTSVPLLGGMPQENTAYTCAAYARQQNIAPAGYDTTVPLDAAQFSRSSGQNKQQSAGRNTLVIVAAICAAAVVITAVVVAVLFINKPSLPVNRPDRGSISAYADQIYTPAQTGVLQTPAAPTVEPTMQPTPEPTPVGYVPEDMPRFADAWPEDYLEDFILQGYYRKYDISELYGFTQEEVALIRNGQFAMSGEWFNKRVNQDYFGAKSWYNPFTDNAESYLNDNQRENASLCKKYEKQMGWLK